MLIYILMLSRPSYLGSVKYFLYSFYRIAVLDSKSKNFSVLYMINLMRNMFTHLSPRQLLVVFMAFAACRNPASSADVIKKYPYWADYLTDPHAFQLNLVLTSPVHVWPGRLFENYTKLMVSK